MSTMEPVAADMGDELQVGEESTAPAGVQGSSADEAVADGEHGSDHSTVPPQEDHVLAACSFIEERLTAELAALKTVFDQRFATNHFREEQISRLHEELQSYRNDLFSKMTRPLLLGLIRLRDDLGKVIGALHQRPAEELTVERFFRVLDDFTDDIELLLGQHGVEAFTAPGEMFDPRRQTALRTVPASSADEAGAVAERLRPGFELGETLLLKERVAVFTAPAANERSGGEAAATTESTTNKSESPGGEE